MNQLVGLNKFCNVAKPFTLQIKVEITTVEGNKREVKGHNWLTYNWTIVRSSLVLSGCARGPHGSSDSFTTRSKKTTDQQVWNWHH